MVRGLGAYSRDPGILEAVTDAGFESVVTPPFGRGGDRFYDDNAWLGLALVRHHELTGDDEFLALAQRIFSFVVSGWSNEPTWGIPGGIRWKEPLSNHSRNTCVNGPAAELAARLHEKTGDATYLDWASRIYDWTRSALLGPDGLYVDQIAPDGTLTPRIWSYNQGSMIGACVLLSRQTGEASFLDQAVETSAAYLGDLSVDQLRTQDPAFNAVLFRNLLLLDRERHDHRYRSLAAEYGSAMWTGGRSRHGLFEGNGSPLNNAAAMVQIYALLAGAEPHA
jgi:rhamnogalacturonyl hydrolase YesR